MVSVFVEARKLLLAGLVLLFLIGGWWVLSHQAKLGTQDLAQSKREGRTSLTAPVEVEVDRPREVAGKLPAGPQALGKQEFFVECRLARDRIRSQQIELYQEIANNPASSGEVRDQVQQELMKLTENMGKETELEKLIMARGFRDAVVLIQPQSATAIVQTRSLSPSEVNKIAELVAKTTGLEVNNITIIPKP